MTTAVSAAASPDGPSREWGFVVPDWTPPSLNHVMGWHWKRKEVFKASVANLLAVYARMAGVPLTTPEYRPVRRVHFLCVYAGGVRLPDPDNLYKLTLDAMTRCRIIVDDGPEWCEVTPPSLQRGSKSATVFTVRDLAHRPAIRPEDDPVVKRYIARMKRKGDRRGP